MERRGNEEILLQFRAVPGNAASTSHMLVVVAAGASLVPGIRAAGVDPAEALRAE
jgi:ABC-type lipoprotein release transport system permease subunit